MRVDYRLTLICLCLFCIGPQAFVPTAFTSIASAQSIVRVGTDEIPSEAVDHLVAARFKQWASTPQEAPQTVRQAVALSLVRRQLAFTRLLDLGGPPLQARIQRRLNLAADSLKRADPEADLPTWQSQDIAWDFAWNEYLSQHLTDENLEAFYKAQAWKFDGTSVLVSQIFRKPGAEGKELLTELKEKISSGELTFDDAAKQYSESPSASQGGQIGWVEYSGDLPTAVAQEALTASPQKPIGPIESPSGWHLLWIEQRKPGTKSFSEVQDRASIQRTASDFLFTRLVRAAAESTDVTWIDTSLQPPASTAIAP
jgi:parvulin-like peptidyl-prolyl isomerase